MQKLLVLFFILTFFVSLSFVVGHGISLIFPQYANNVLGILLIASALSVLLLFIFDTGDKA